MLTYSTILLPHAYKCTTSHTARSKLCMPSCWIDNPAIWCRTARLQLPTVWARVWEWFWWAHTCVYAVCLWCVAQLLECVRWLNLQTESCSCATLSSCILLRGQFHTERELQWRFLFWNKTKICFAAKLMPPWLNHPSSSLWLFTPKWVAEVQTDSRVLLK